MTETPTHDPDLELARQWGALLGEHDGRRAAISLIRAEAYLGAFHREIRAAGLCHCPDDEPLADWERNLLATESGRCRCADAQDDPHTQAEHTNCGDRGEPCGMCNTCMSARRVVGQMGDPAGRAADPTGLTVPCDGTCGSTDVHDSHLAPGALERLGTPGRAAEANQEGAGEPDMADEEDRAEEPIHRCTFCLGIVHFNNDGDWYHEDRSRENHEATPPDDDEPCPQCGSRGPHTARQCKDSGVTLDAMNRLDRASQAAPAETPEHTDAVYDDGVAKLRETRATGGIMSSPAAGSPIVITSQPDPDTFRAMLRDEMNRQARRRPGSSHAAA